MIKFNEVTWYSNVATLIFFLIFLPVWTFYLCNQCEKTTESYQTLLAGELSFIVPEYENLTYTIEGQPIKLTSGHADTPDAPGSASKTTTKYFGNEASGDLNSDGIPDVAFLLTQDGGGSGTFYYVVVALKTSNGYVGTNGIFLGDRISPQSTEIRNGQLIVNYADRKINDPMSEPTSVGMTKYLKIEGTYLVETQNAP